MKHDWKVEGLVGMYDTTYKCSRCGKLHTESSDNPNSTLPEDGCKYSQDVIRKELAKLEIVEKQVQRQREALQKHCTHPTANKKYDSIERFTLCNCPDCKLSWTEVGRT